MPSPARVCCLSVSRGVVAQKRRRPAGREAACRGGRPPRRCRAVDRILVRRRPRRRMPTGSRRLPPRGTPVSSEPLCEDPDPARRLAAAGRDHLFVMDGSRCRLGVLALADIAHSGELGQAVGLRTMRVGFGSSRLDTDCVWTCWRRCGDRAGDFWPVTPPVAAVADRAGRDVMGLTAMSAAQEESMPGPWHIAAVGIRSRSAGVPSRCYAATVSRLGGAYADHLVVVADSAAERRGGGATATQRPLKVEMPLLAELSALIGFLDGRPPPQSPAEEAAETVATIVQLRRLPGFDTPDHVECRAQGRGQPAARQAARRIVLAKSGVARSRERSRSAVERIALDRRARHSASRMSRSIVRAFASPGRSRVRRTSRRAYSVASGRARQVSPAR